MDFTMRLSSVAASSIYTTDFLSPKSSLKQLTLQTSPVIGRCISEIQISSEKTSPLPTPISMNFSKPKTPTCVSRSSFVLKKLEKTDQKLKKIESCPKINIVKPKKKKIVSRKTELKKETESKPDPVKEKTLKSQEKHKILKNLSKNIRKMNLKFSKKPFVQKAKWGSTNDQLSKFTIFEKISSIKLKKPKKAKDQPKCGKKKSIKKVKKTPPISHNEPSLPIPEKSKFNPLNPEKFLSLIVKIQATIRGWLIRRKIKYLKEPKFSLEFSNHVSAFHSSTQSHELEDIEVQNILKQKLEQSFSHLFPNLTPLNTLERRGRNEVNRENFLSAEIAMKVKQSMKLKELQMNDLQEMKAIAEKFCNKDEIVEVFTNIIQRRYEKLSSFFDKSIQKFQTHLYSTYNPDEDQYTPENHIKVGQKLSPSIEIGEDIEKMLQEIEKIEEDEANSFLCDPQPLPPLTPIYEETREPFQKFQNLEFDLKPSADTSKSELKPDPPSKLFPSTPQYQSSNVAKEPEPSIFKSKHAKNELFPISSSNTLENSEAIKDFSSIRQTAPVESCENSTSLHKDLGIKPVFSLKNTKWPSSSPKLLESDSIINPFSTSDESCKIVNLSEENYILERVINLLELCVYHELIENNIEFIADDGFLIRITEGLIMKYIDDFVAETTKPILIETGEKFVKTDSINLLYSIDQEFAKILVKPEDLKSKIVEVFDPLTQMKNIQFGQKINYLELPTLVRVPETLDSYSYTHLKAVFNACTQAIISTISTQQSAAFDFVYPKIDKLKLNQFFISIREILFRWNELQGGNMPTQETLKENGDLDEDKLQSLRIQSLAKLLYQDLEEDNLAWVNYLFEEEQIFIDIEKLVFIDLVSETFNFF